jgi:hypothetical protein
MFLFILLLVVVLVIQQCASLQYNVLSSKIRFSQKRIFSTSNIDQPDLVSESIKIENDNKPCGPCPLAPKCSGLYSTKGCDGTGQFCFKNHAIKKKTKSNNNINLFISFHFLFLFR